MQIHQLTVGLVLTFDEEGLEEMHGERMHIKIMPIWKWLISGEG